MKKIIFTLLCMFSIAATFSQTDVSGTVKDNLGVPVTGANVLIIGSTSGATSDFDGNFSFSTNLTGVQKIKISYLGYEAQEQTVTLNGTPITLQIVLVEGGNSLDEVVLTASATFRSQKDTPMSISSLKQNEITKLSANSQADILRSIPGITAEGGGGETASNVFVRGLPSGGQYVFNPLQYDGMPLMSTFGLNSSAHDVYARPDIGFKGVEFVRGGAAVLYGAGSVAGIINYTSKTGDSNEENIINMEWADKGRLKTDFYTGGKLGGEDSNTYYAFTGFVRKDDGPIETGMPTKGVQFRANIKKKFENGSFTVHGQFINDNAQFIMPLPLDGNRKRINGNDGEAVEQLLSGELANTSFLTAGGAYESPIEDGVSTQGGYLMADFKYDFADDLKFKSKVKYANYKHNFALYVGGNGANNNPITLNEYVENVAPGNLGFTAQYQGTSAAINGSDLVVDNLHVDRLRPMTDYSGEASLTKTIEVTNGTHNITGGVYLARTEAEDVNYQYRVLSEFNNNPKLVNLNYVDAGGNDVTFSTGGLYNRIGMTSNNFLSQNKTAVYLTDEMVLDKWRFDVGLRIENTQGTFSKGNIVESQVYDDATLTPELANVNFADGSFTRADVSATDWALSAAGLYKLNDKVNLYANFSRGFFFPQIRGFAPIATGVTGSKYDSEKIIQFEVGAKLGTEKLKGSVAAYYVGLSDRIKIDQGFVSGSLVDLTRSEQSTKTIGLEATFDYSLADNLSLRGTATYQDHEISKNVSTDLTTNTSSTTNEGNELARQPNFLGSLGAYYDDGAFDALFSFNHTGSKFAADNNTVELDAITIARIGAGYEFAMGDNDSDDTLRLGFSVFNLFNDEGVTEGDPRNVNQAGDAEFFFGRPILPRRFFLTATFNF
ncbi:TonB-dependent receptor [Algibacter amylolyticus]|uniref:TonB-dependent receptor n=1 Tax=Algibacter amylolyticus TaxID=1608400 RepID=A0A5M7BK74_9FLAO|nr:TonB-dependent receptor [Algibacter amylolyticus]KAA5827884.1 TonB-dependent receptor [Algibacter amylolyticus]MBB5267115.1 outer membrane receptor protein involved in Fe transport [Algibacter amylolyticus]TSJ82129.1 TonB-dependent receptor [Algibacter amylolyticus]